ncbi:unnamed protein product [Bursaphelenchus okinawaensis]|uniref:EGF-like domain-containing protein n=1 Tax=Bursaphelenchus okinawaensis TaxID=465554 RepID=A0A811LRY1_9BILA|nr:unnamed protein product [Bursaphelenchus okinawaensis]CAG9127538.1 unnamed protein product [Bursaphelenchus okinawaensis]
MKTVWVVVVCLLIVEASHLHHHNRHRRKINPKRRIVCVNGQETDGACICSYGFIGKHCEYKMYCSTYQRHDNGSCLSCNKHYEGPHCADIVCVNGERDEESVQTCNCKKPYKGQYCDVLETEDVYYLYNSKVAIIGPLGALLVIPMIMIYYGCEHYAKKRQVKRIKKVWSDQTALTVDDNRIKTLLY